MLVLLFSHTRTSNFKSFLPSNNHLAYVWNGRNGVCLDGRKIRKKNLKFELKENEEKKFNFFI